MNYRRMFWCVFLPPLLAVAHAMAGEQLRLFVNSRAYDVAIAPVDEESKNAETSILYGRSGSEREWKNLGDSRKIAIANGDIRFVREVVVEMDGTYEYTSRPVVGGEVAEPPRPEDRAQAVVVVDTLPPTVEILAPPESHRVLPGDEVGISWVVSDENLPAAPAALAYSTDGGRSWIAIGDALPARGERDWTAPADLAGPAVLRLVAVDSAGNAGRAVRGMELRERALAIAPPPPPPTAPEEQPAPAVTPEIPAPEEPAFTDLVAVPERARDSNRSWLYYLMAINHMRQNKPADALQYYWLSVREDPEFIDAWADIALAYIDLGAYKSAREVVEQTRERDPERIDLLHLMGETYHAEGMELLGGARSGEERTRAKGLIDQAVSWYGRALDKASDEWRLAEQAASFYRLGEVCYYVNLDKDGARAYWAKILTLHSPTPNMDLLLWSSKKDRPAERKRHERYTHQRVALETWQNWARGYIDQMDARERAGIADLMPARKGTSALARIHSLSYAGNELNPMQDDGRSLFSLPSSIHGGGAVVAQAGPSGQPSFQGYGAADATPWEDPRSLTEGYSFYGGAEGQGNARSKAHTGGARKRGMGMFSGREERPVVAPDPYDFPARGRTPAPWSGSLPYGSQPIPEW